MWPTHTESLSTRSWFMHCYLQDNCCVHQPYGLCVTLEHFVSRQNTKGHPLWWADYSQWREAVKNGLKISYKRHQNAVDKCYKRINNQKDPPRSLPSNAAAVTGTVIPCGSIQPQQALFNNIRPSPSCCDDSTRNHCNEMYYWHPKGYVIAKRLITRDNIKSQTFYFLQIVCTLFFQFFTFKLTTIFRKCP